MPRPRVHDPDTVLDAAEALAVRAGPAAVTVRAVAAATGMSNGALYHTFGSRGALLARAWVRAARRFLDVQRALAFPETAEAQGSSDAEAAVTAAIVAAAEAPSVFAERFPDSARLVLTVSREQLLDADLPAELAAELRGAERDLVAVLVDLAQRRWGRRDRRAVQVLTTCLVDLPTAILLRRDQLADPHARHQLRAAVRAVLDIGPPERKSS